jgi:predicted dithiol-disulfide oxidoreductase (DUF899 family)
MGQVLHGSATTTHAVRTELQRSQASAAELARRAAFHVVAKSPIARLMAFARQRGWQHMSLLSTAGNCYDGDYIGDITKLSKAIRFQHRVPVGQNWDETTFNVFKKRNGKSITFGARRGPSRALRRASTTAPATRPIPCGTDMTPDGRGFPKVEY